MYVFSQPGKSAFLVFDQGIREKLKAADGYVKKGFAKEAATIEELAKKLGIDPKNMVTSIDQYNQYVKNGKDTDFNKDILPKELNQGPFYAIEVSPAVHHTMGGVRINNAAEVLDTNNNAAEVLDTNGKPVKGLYAAGEVTGGVHGGNRIGGNAMTDITVFGKIAGENAASFIKTVK